MKVDPKLFFMIYLKEIRNKRDKNEAFKDLVKNLEAYVVFSWLLNQQAKNKRF